MAPPLRPPIPPRARGHGHGHGHAHAGEARPRSSGALAPALGANSAFGVDADSAECGSGGAGDSVAVRAAMAHVIGDLLQSIGVVVAAVLIYFLHDRWPDKHGLSYWYRVDPICTLLFAVLVMASTYDTIKDCTMVLMCAAPGHIDPSRVHAALLRIRGVEEVHDLHIWALVPDKVNVSAHVRVARDADHAQVLYAAQAAARRFGCVHTVFQLEDSSAFQCHVEGSWCPGQMAPS
mmetsp:Transcript_4729/g.13903  ORF Transcript_4729/g.13903 Transcript_4729/m.13903 type:complete len:235 (+) Transcript_4729:237-941(+)